MAKKKSPKASASIWVRESTCQPKLYTLEVFIISGMIADDFIDENPEISRQIQIRGDQTLADLHEIIFEAFDRFDEHLWEFELGKGPDDPKAPRYRSAHALKFADDPALKSADEATIDSLKLKVDRAFGYWFDFGDDWMHQINVVAVEEAPAKGKYPKIISRVGKSPPQYMNMDEEEEGDEEED